MKKFRLFVITASLAAAIVLWFTRTEDLESQSAYAFSPNAIWYYIMHLGIMYTFLIDCIRHKYRWQSLAVTVSGFFVVVLDMYSFSLLHNLATVSLILNAMFNIVHYAPNKFERIYAISLSVFGTIFFMFSYFAEAMSIFFGELLLEAFIATIMIRRISAEK